MDAVEQLEWTPAEEASAELGQLDPERQFRSLASAVAAALRSDATPSFPQTMERLFTEGTGLQRAGLLNTLIGAAGPDVALRVLGYRMLGRELTPQEADLLAPRTAALVAVEAEKRDPTIIERVSELVATHPVLAKALGERALNLILSHAAHGPH